MGNDVGKLTICFTGPYTVHRRKHTAVAISDPINDLGHSFCYVRPDPSRPAEETTTFRSISGASVSANTSTPLSTSFIDVYSYTVNDKASAFESSTSFASIPLQPRTSIYSGPIAGSGPIAYSGPIERGFQSGPLFSGPMEKGGYDQFQRSYSQGGLAFKRRSRKPNLIRVIRRAISRTFSTRGQKSSVAPISKNVGDLKDHDWVVEKQNELTISSVNLGSEGSLLGDDESLKQRQNVQWAQGKAGEDRVHVVVSEEHGWVFVGIYDGFNGPDAPDFLLCNMYETVHKELKGLLWHDQSDSSNLNSNGSESVNHLDVLKALSQGLKKTEEAYFDVADLMLDENPELALMGSCVLVMLMKGEDVYVMNVGDSRVVLAQKSGETLCDVEVADADIDSANPSLTACQLTVDHSTSIEEEVERIKSEHPDDVCAVMNDRVKGSLKVTRAFGAGFLKQPKWNNALLEMFRIDYVGNGAYINCHPYLHHHRLGPRDRFLILSSDGLYQYFTNEEAVSEVELFIQWSPEGDPAQHLVEEVLLRAAKKAGMDFHELLEIPQGDRRRYHDDVSIIVISLEGRIWRSCV